MKFTSWCKKLTENSDFSNVFHCIISCPLFKRNIPAGERQGKRNSRRELDICSQNSVTSLVHFELFSISELWYQSPSSAGIISNFLSVHLDFFQEPFSWENQNYFCLGSLACYAKGTITVSWFFLIEGLIFFLCCLDLVAWSSRRPFHSNLLF